MEIIKLANLKSILENIEAKKLYTDRNIEIINIAIAPSQSIPTHKNDIPALFTITSGKGKLTANGEEVDIEAGDFVRIEKDLDRKWENTGNTTLNIIVTKLLKS
jgi:quercetin dioxygenase-like cupin family protein